MQKASKPGFFSRELSLDRVKADTNTSSYRATRRLQYPQDNLTIH